MVERNCWGCTDWSSRSKGCAVVECALTWKSESCDSIECVVGLECAICIKILTSSRKYTIVSSHCWERPSRCCEDVKAYKRHCESSESKRSWWLWTNCNSQNSCSWVWSFEGNIKYIITCGSCIESCEKYVSFCSSCKVGHPWSKVNILSECTTKGFSCIILNIEDGCPEVYSFIYIGII